LRWTVQIVDDAAPFCDPTVMDSLVHSKAATTPLPTIDAEGDGWNDYAGDLDPELRLERFSTAALVVLLDEFALQGHLLARSFLLAVQRRHGTDTAARMGTKQVNGIVGLTAKRLTRHLGTTGTLADIAKVIDLHPAFRPRSYVDLEVDLTAAARDHEFAITLVDCPALHEQDNLSWPALLAKGTTDAVNVLIQAVNPQARCEPIDSAGERGWMISIDESAEPAKESDDVLVTSFSTGADFTFAAPHAQERTSGS
jgi:hypothetical protein